MFELSVALKYLLPKWRQLSVSIISLISIIVIALVVWLIVVFFSVTYSLEKTWVQKLIALTAPVRVTPTSEYYTSHYYLIDGISAAADYNLKSIREKLLTDQPDVYNSEVDEEIPAHWPKSESKDLVKAAFASINQIPGVRAHDYEMAVAQIKLPTVRHGEEVYQSYTMYLSSYDAKNPALPGSLVRVGDNPPKVLEKLEGGILLPKSFIESGVRLGEPGYISYQTPTASTVIEQQLPVFVAGFYDPGIIPLGNKVVLVNPQTVTLIRSSFQMDESPLSNGINVHFDNLERADSIKASLVKAFKEQGIDKYWKVQTYREYDFTKDILQQLHSEKNLFTILSTVIIIVACSNIISMLIILVNDKKVEIGILRSMGATSRSIAAIFGLCGVVMGILGSAIGIIAAIITLHNLQSLVNFISRVQGFEMFNPMFYGETLPADISFHTLGFVILATGFVSLLAGIVPAVKASMMRPSEILRSE